MSNLKFKYGDIIFVKVYHINFHEYGQVFDYDKVKKQYRVCFFLDDMDPSVGFRWSYVNEEDIELEESDYTDGPYYDKDSILDVFNYRNLYSFSYYLNKLYHENRITLEEFFKIQLAYVDEDLEVKRTGKL